MAVRLATARVNTEPLPGSLATVMSPRADHRDRNAAPAGDHLLSAAQPISRAGPLGHLAVDDLGETH